MEKEQAYYDLANAIIKKCARDMKLPADLVYPFVKLGAKIYGKFDLEEVSPIEAMKKANVPVIFFHGDTDGFVPHEMSVENYEACITKKKLVTVAGAGHGLCYIMESQRYLEELAAFSNECGVPTKIVL